MSYTSAIEERPEELLASGIEALQRAVPLLRSSMDEMEEMMISQKRFGISIRILMFVCCAMVVFAIVDLIAHPSGESATAVFWNVIALIYVSMLKRDVDAKSRILTLMIAVATASVASAHVVVSGSDLVLDLKKMVSEVKA
jgi:hypothetical protein